MTAQHGAKRNAGVGRENWPESLGDDKTKMRKSVPSSARRELSPLMTAISAAIRQVPRGRVSTYGAIASAAGYPRCARHVARVLRQVPGLPWQRILGSGGRISLRGEAALEQRFLLEAEGVRFRGRRADLTRFEHHFPTARHRQRVSSGIRRPAERKTTAPGLRRQSESSGKNLRPKL
jgi:methylated-DNA-protein-cysteine methyltransferase-like protein